MGVLFDLSLVNIRKSLGITQPLTEECLKLIPRDQDRGVDVMSPLILLPAEADPVLLEKRGQGNSGRLRGSGGSKIVLILLAEVVTVYVKLSMVYFRGTGLQLFPGHFGDGSWGGSGSGSSSIQNGFKNPLQVILGVFEDTSIKHRP